MSIALLGISVDAVDPARLANLDNNRSISVIDPEGNEFNLVAR
jgi:hypothetical protein